jgi:hypothetical protein
MIGYSVGAVPLRLARLHSDRAEETGVDRAAVSLAARHGRAAVHHVTAFALRVDGVDRVAARRNETARIDAHVRAIRGDAAHELHPHHVNRGGARARLIVVDRRRGQEILEVDRQTVAHVHPQHQRTRPFALAQMHIARHQPLGRIDRHHIAPQRVDHPLRLYGAEPIPEKDLIKRNDVRADPPLTVAGQRDGPVVLREKRDNRQKQGGEKQRGESLRVHASQNAPAPSDTHRSLR